MKQVPEKQASTWTLWLASLLVLAGILGLGFYRHPLRDDDADQAATKAAAPVLMPGEVRLDALEMAQEGIRTRIPKALGRDCLIPCSAILYVDGKAFVYVETVLGDFQREQVSREGRVSQASFLGGGESVWRFVGTSSWKAGQAVVGRGAATVLSQEFKPKKSSGGVDDD